MGERDWGGAADAGQRQVSCPDNPRLPRTSVVRGGPGDVPSGWSPAVLRALVGRSVGGEAIVRWCVLSTTSADFGLIVT
jgi:hypothetical protein